MLNKSEKFDRLSGRQVNLSIEPRYTCHSLYSSRLYMYVFCENYWKLTCTNNILYKKEGTCTVDIHRHTTSTIYCTKNNTRLQGKICALEFPSLCCYNGTPSNSDLSEPMLEGTLLNFDARLNSPEAAFLVNSFVDIIKRNLTKSMRITLDILG